MARTRECQYCRSVIDEACWCFCAEEQRDMCEFDAMVRARKSPKPATAEPPEWKGELAAPTEFLMLTELERLARERDREAYAQSIEDCAACGGEGGWDESVSSPDWNEWRTCSTCKGTGIAKKAPEPSPLDRALSDFISRRRNKRKKKLAKWNRKHNEEARALASVQEVAEAERAAPISRAMLTPITFTAKLGGR